MDRERFFFDRPFDTPRISSGATQDEVEEVRREGCRIFLNTKPLIPSRRVSAVSRGRIEGPPFDTPRISSGATQDEVKGGEVRGFLGNVMIPRLPCRRLPYLPHRAAGKKYTDHSKIAEEPVENRQIVPFHPSTCGPQPAMLPPRTTARQSIAPEKGRLFIKCSYRGVKALSGVSFCARRGAGGFAPRSGSGSGRRRCRRPMGAPRRRLHPRSGPRPPVAPWQPSLGPLAGRPIRRAHGNGSCGVRPLPGRSCRQPRRRPSSRLLQPLLGLFCKWDDRAL